MVAPRGSPKDELPCIWVQAGVLSYRPCPLDYDCERCELYHALRGQHEGEALPRFGPGSGSADRASAYICALTRGCKLYVDRPYSPCHFWLQAERSGKVLLGLDTYLLRLLYPIDDITLPHAGVLMRRDEPCGWITRGRLAVPLRAPIAGEVEAVNEPLLDQVRNRGGVNGADDWLLRLATLEAPADVPGLYRGEATLIWYLKKVQLLKTYLAQVLQESGEERLGVVLDDGGVANPNVEGVLGRERFEALVEDMFRVQI